MALHMLCTLLLRSLCIFLYPLPQLASVIDALFAGGGPDGSSQVGWGTPQGSHE